MCHCLLLSREYHLAINPGMVSFHSCIYTVDHSDNTNGNNCISVFNNEFNTLGSISFMLNDCGDTSKDNLVSPPPELSYTN